MGAAVCVIPRARDAEAVGSGSSSGAGLTELVQEETVSQKIRQLREATERDRSEQPLACT